VGVYPRLEARLAAIHLGCGDEEEEVAVEDTGCAECGGSKDAAYDKPCSEKGDDADEGDDCPCSDDDDTKDAGSGCGCDQ
jgi:hypothetical protein